MCIIRNWIDLKSVVITYQTLNSTKKNKIKKGPYFDNKIENKYSIVIKKQTKIIIT